MNVLMDYLDHDLDYLYNYMTNDHSFLRFENNITVNVWKWICISAARMNLCMNSSWMYICKTNHAHEYYNLHNFRTHFDFMSSSDLKWHYNKWQAHPHIWTKTTPTCLSDQWQTVYEFNNMVQRTVTERDGTYMYVKT